MTKEVGNTPNVVTGKSSIRTYPVEVLFDFGDTHSFISARLVKTLELAPTSRHSLLHIALPNGKVVNYKELLKLPYPNLWP